MRYFVVIDMPDELYSPTRDDGFYATSGGDPHGRVSFATYITASLDEAGARPLDLTVYSHLDDLLSDRDEGLDMFAEKGIKP